MWTRWRTTEAVLLVLAAGFSCSLGWAVPLTNDNLDDQNPQIDSGQVVWEHFDGNDGEIMLWNGTSVQQLTNNSLDDQGPRISHGQVAWQQWDGHDSEIVFWNGTTVQQLTNNDFDDTNPDISNGHVVWEGWDGTDWEIYHWCGGPTDPPPLGGGNDFDDRYPKIDRTGPLLVVWQGREGGDWDIFKWDGGAPVNLTADSAQDEIDPAVGSSAIAWQGWRHFVGSNWTIFYNGQWITPYPPNPPDNVNPSVDDGYVAWEVGSSIGLWVNGTSHDLGPGARPRVRGGRVVWQTMDAANHDLEIATWTGSEVILLSNNNVEDKNAETDAGHVVWQFHDGIDWEIQLVDVVTAPRIVQVTPPPGRSDVPLGTAVKVTFSLPMAKAETKSAFALKDVTDPAHPQPVAGRFSWSSDGKRMTFEPRRRLGFGKAYQAKVAAAALSEGRVPLANPKKWTFHTVASAAGRSQAVLSSATAVPNRAGGAQVAFTLSAPASVDVEVLNLAGRPVAKAATGRACEAGMNTVLWSGMSAAGTRVPAGTYLVRIAARTAEGAKAEALATLRIER